MILIWQAASAPALVCKDSANGDDSDVPSINDSQLLRSRKKSSQNAVLAFDLFSQPICLCTVILPFEEFVAGDEACLGPH
jgi:hypothetical protein